MIWPASRNRIARDPCAPAISFRSAPPPSISSCSSRSELGGRPGPLGSGGPFCRHRRLVRRGGGPRAMGPPAALDRHGTDVGRAAAASGALRRRRDGFSPAPVPFRGGALVVIAAAAISLGTLARFVALERLPPSLWIDDISLIAPALDLKGVPGDFANAIRPAPYGVSKTYGSVGVLYLELYRGALLLFGTTVFGVRFLSAAAGVASLFSALALGRA